MEEVLWKRQLKRSKVFVIDESALFGAMIKTNLESALECSVRCFESGKELFDDMVFDYPDVIIVDFKLGFSANADHMNGMDIYQNLQEVASTVPIIGITSESEERYLDDLRMLGVSEVLNKSQGDFLDSLGASIKQTLEQNNN